VVLNSPNNPTGASYSERELRELAEVVLSHERVWLLSDDIYEHFHYGEGKALTPLEVVPELAERSLSVNGVSKTYAMTGWRIGFGLVPTAIVGAMTKLQSHSTSNPTSISQKAAVEALRGPQESVGIMLAEYRKRRDFVVQRLRQIPGVTCAEPRGAFYAYPNIGATFNYKGMGNTLQFAEKLLAEAHVAVVPGEAFGTDRHVRISYATSMHELERGLDRIHQFIVKNA
jgi:aspartate aminotransferase